MALNASRMASAPLGRALAGEEHRELHERVRVALGTRPAGLAAFAAFEQAVPEPPRPDCGNVALLRQHEGFRWRPESLAEGCAVRLFERTIGLQRRAGDLPLLEIDAG